MANAGSINFDFTASVSDLEQKAIVAQKIIEDKVAKQIDSIGTKSTVSDKKIVTMMKNMAREGRAVSPMLGKIGVAIAGIDAVVVPLYRSFETFFARMQPGLERMGASLLAFVTTPTGIAVVAVAALSAAAIALYAVFGQAENKAKAYSNAIKTMEKANEDMRESIRIGTLSAAIDRDQAAWFKAKIEGYKKSLKTGADELQKITKLNEFEIAKILEGKGEVPAPQAAPPADPSLWTGWGWGKNPANERRDEEMSKSDVLVNTLRKQQKMLDSYTKQLAYLETAEANAAELAKDRASAAEDAAADSIRAQEKQSKAVEAAAEKEIAAQERLESQAKARAQADAERAQAEAEQHAARLDMMAIASAQVQQSQYAFYDWAASLQANMADVYQGIQSIAQMATQGVADAFARTIVYGESLGEAFDALWKQMAASLISMVIQVALQQLVYLAMTALGVAAGASVKLAGEVAYGTVAAAASAYAGLPFPANMIAGPIAGAAAMANLMSLGAAGITAGAGLGAASLTAGAFAEGGIVTGSMLAMVGEGGQDELIAPRSDYERLFESARGERSLHIYLDGQELTRSVAKELPRELRKHGVR